MPGMGARFPTYLPTVDVMCEQKQTSRMIMLGVLAFLRPFKHVLLWLQRESLCLTFPSLDDEREA